MSERTRRHFLRTLGAAAGATMALPLPLHAQTRRRLRVGVGPFLPTAEDTRRAYTPFFTHVAKQLGAPDFQLDVTTDWAGLAVAMATGNLDLAWMGPWGYVLANNASGCQAIATVRYDDRPTYNAIIVARPDLKVGKFPDDTRGLSMSFADSGSTSGWLVPTYFSREVWKIDPKTFWKYNEGASHPANQMAVASGQVDLATDFDRNRNAMIAAGRIKPEQTRIVWTSPDLPNDAIAVSKTMSAADIATIQRVILALTLDEAKTLLPPRYTGFSQATHASYATIEAAGIAVGRLKRLGG
ncbi:MAG: phosphate/phosphite/phosphonate ABC transporter substrate-binding protein [Proteobacteria bacterium]|nr:phosphate/phosphite/phosphonate ABC transporter substrate-binding protein [Burkholderiales bacterium]